MLTFHEGQLTFYFAKSCENFLLASAIRIARNNFWRKKFLCCCGLGTLAAAAAGTVSSISNRELTKRDHFPIPLYLSPSHCTFIGIMLNEQDWRLPGLRETSLNNKKSVRPDESLGQLREKDLQSWPPPIPRKGFMEKMNVIRYRTMVGALV